MKKNILNVICLVLVHIVTAQVTDTGNKVGVGTTTPEAKLEVKSSGTIGGAWNPSSSYFSVTDGGSSLLLDPNEIYGSGVLHIGSLSGDIVKFRNITSTGAVDQFIIKNNGYVGVGTVNPNSKFHLSSNTGDVVIRIEADTDNDNEYDNPLIEFRQDGDIVGINLGFSENFGENLFGIGTRHTNSGPDKWDTFIINPTNGYIGIGTTSPDSKLTVAGNIHSREVKVTVNAGADFVFEDNYNLPSLEEVQRFIQDNGHLPEIESAKDMETNGIHLAEMNIKLLQKIEELTLYAIEQEKEIEDLKKQNERIDQLEEKLNQILTK